MLWQQIVVYILFTFIIVALYLNVIGVAFTFLSTIIVLGVTGILTPSEILHGFSNEQILIIIMLLLLSDVMQKSSWLNSIFDRVFSSSRTLKSFITRMMLFVSFLSAFFNNTPLVAIIMPYVHKWCREHKISPAKLLIPLSFAAILGGCATLIGTSTNLITNSLVQDQKIVEGFTSMAIFDFALVGVPMAFIGILYMATIGRHLLPDNKDLLEDFTVNSREYLVETRIGSNSKFIGKTIEEAQLRNLQGLFLVEIVRRGSTLKPVSPKTIIESEDLLVFAGETSTILEMVNQKGNMSLSQVGMFSKKHHTQIIETVISYNSTLIGKKIKESNFRGRFDAAIIAVHRNGERLSGKIGDIQLKAGDVLLLIVGEDFNNRLSGSPDFYLISNLKDIRKFRWYENYLLFGGLFAVIIFSALGLIKLFNGLLALLFLTVVLKLSSPKEIHKKIDYNLGLIIALALAFGTAMVNTGVAGQIAGFLLNLFKPFGILGTLFGFYFVTSLLAAYVTNVAAVALIFPIAISSAVQMELAPLPFALLVAHAAAANFLTPHGYQTNLMVFGPGGYTYKMFFKVGMPLTFIYMVVTVSIIYLYYF